MKHTLRGLLFVLVFTFCAGTTFAADVFVDCTGANPPGTYPSLTAALMAIPQAGPNNVYLSGTCADNAYIYGRTDLTIYGISIDAGLTPGNPNRALLSISGSRVILVGLTFTGGFGVNIFDQSNVYLTSVVVQNSTRQGLQTHDSYVQMDTTTIANNARQGLYVDGGVVSLNGGVNVNHSGRNGAYVTAAAKFIAGDGGPGFENYFQNNGSSGLAIDANCFVNLTGDNRILANNSYGIYMLHTSTLYFMGGGQVTGNGSGGIHVGETSHGEFSDVLVQNNGATTASPGIEIVNNSDAYIDGGVSVNSNAAQGILVDMGSVLESLGSNTIAGNGAEGIFLYANGTLRFDGADTITNNLNANLACDTTSFVTGNLGSLTNVKCAKIENGTGRRYPGHPIEKP